jgi:agmatine deiminase
MAPPSPGHDAFPGAPAALGYRLPAEWEPHAATWIAWPHRRATFLGPFAPIPRAYARIVRTLARHEPVCVIGSGSVLDEASRMVGSAPGVTLVDIPTNDSWIRDTGPVFLLPRDRDAGRAPTGAAGGIAAVAWEWNAWGGKYPPWDDDARVAGTIAARLGLRTFSPGIVLEGGAIETDGDGTLLANERCVVDPRRNPGLDRDGTERILRDFLAVERVLWVGGDLSGDDTDGHIDQLARFVAPGRVVAARQPDPLDPNHAALAANLDLLRGHVDARGRRLEVIPIDIPPRYAFAGTQLPASHLNFYVGNGFVGVPVFGARTDDAALATLAACFPGRRIEPVDCTAIVRGRGGLHCITRDEPSVASSL